MIVGSEYASRGVLTVKDLATGQQSEVAVDAFWADPLGWPKPDSPPRRTMTRRHIHYEAAFEDYLRSRGVPYVPVDEAKRVIFGGEKVKSFDFLVYPGDEQHWIVDIKGRQFPYISEQGARRILGELGRQGRLGGAG